MSRSAETESSYIFDSQTIPELRQGLKKGEFTSSDLVRHALEKIHRLNPKFNAFVCVSEEAALRRAEEIDSSRGDRASSLSGIPIGIKDMIFTKDMPTTMGSEFFRDYRPSANAASVELLQNAGAVTVGKTQTHEFAYGPTGNASFRGPVKNPLDPRKMSGGSSSGSAAAVAAGMVPASLGTDTGGSVRIPAALCGLTGLKPGLRKISNRGVFPLSRTLDSTGILARRPEDVFAVYRMLLSEKNRSEAESSLTLPALKKTELKSLRLGLFPLELFLPPCPTFIRTETLLHTAFKDRRGMLPPPVREDALPGGLRENLRLIEEANARIKDYEVLRLHAERMASAPDLYCPSVLERLRNVPKVSPEQYAEGRKSRILLRRRWMRLFEHYDFILMPTVPLPAPDLMCSVFREEGLSLPINTVLLSLTYLWNFLGFPALTIPLARQDGLPLGLQLIGKPGSETRLLGFGEFLLS